MQLEHNIRYEAHYSIIVEALDHRLCIDTYNRFKYLRNKELEEDTVQNTFIKL